MRYAQYPGTCSDCGKPIKRGDPIELSLKGPMHQTCADRPRAPTHVHTIEPRQRPRLSKLGKLDG